MIVLLVKDFVMHTSALWAYIPILVLGFNDEINGIVLGWKSLKKSIWFILFEFEYVAKVRTI